jgi:xanthosine utilization system XapX-like protein
MLVMLSKTNGWKFLLDDNFLNLLYLLSFQIMKNKFFKAISVMVLLFHSVIHLIQIGHLVATFDRILLIKYVTVFMVYTMVSRPTVFLLTPYPTQFICLQGLLGIIVGLAVIPDSYSLHKEITNISWNTKKFGLKYEQEPKLETRIIALGALLNLALVLLASALHWHAAFVNGDLFYAVLLFNKLENPALSNVLCHLYCSTLPLMGYAMVHNSFVLIYLILKVKDRFNLLDNVLEDLRTNHDGADDNVLLEDANYQNKIFEMLKVCIYQHSFLKR